MRCSPTLVVAGYGMVGHKVVEALVRSGGMERWRVVVVGEEPRPAYDRVNLTSYLSGRSAGELSVVDASVAAHPLVEVLVGEAVTAIDRSGRAVVTGAGRRLAYDAVVLATGSAPFVPPVPGTGGPGCFVYRTLEDLDAIREAAGGVASGVVVGGGLLGLEAADALSRLGLATQVVERAPRLMPAQLDARGGALLAERVEALGIGVRTGVELVEVARDARGRLVGLGLAGGELLKAGLVVFSAGVRPRHELAPSCGLEVGPRGGVAVDGRCRSADPRIWAVGECASVEGRVYGLVGPGYAMARLVAAQLCAPELSLDQVAPVGPALAEPDTSTKLKLLGVDVASFGDAQGATPGCRALSWEDPVSGVYHKLVLDAPGTTLLGGMLVGDASAYDGLRRRWAAGGRLDTAPRELLFPAAGPAGPAAPAGDLSGADLVCTCNHVTKAQVVAAVAGTAGPGGRPEGTAGPGGRPEGTAGPGGRPEGTAGCTTVAGLKAACGAGTGCGSCLPLVKAILESELEAAGVAVDRSLCPHFAFTRVELFDIVRGHRVRTFAGLIEGWGRGRGCEVCKPAVASMLASAWDDHVLADEHLPLQDTNDRFLANIQRDGTYSVVPRVPAGEITPAQLIALGQVAADFDLYTKVTGAQRVDLLGARLDQLPHIWRRLVEAGFESGHAYGKALRTVKSCVGSTWCRYGVQDSVALAVDLELRYRGLRSPHKIKGGVSGCSRECAEAQGKDFGVIATEAGWNVYVCGNGGMKPRHGVLLAADVDTATLVRYLDRFLMFYVRTADRLERTATWLARMEGGIDYLRRVVVDDALGIGAQLEADMGRHVAAYRCEWKAILDDPRQLARFSHFVNDATPDPALAYGRQRGQRVPVSVPVSVSAR